jgi:hypothetical protein
VKRTNILAALLVALTLVATGCGSSDYVESVQLSATGASSGGFYNLVGIDGTLQLNVNAVYHSGKTVPVTNDSTFAVTSVDAGGGAPPAYGPSTVPINSTGVMTAEIGLCTWTDLGNPQPTPPQYNWFLTGYYQIVATYKGMQSQPIAVGVGSAAGDAPDGSCGPS